MNDDQRSTQIQRTEPNEFDTALIIQDVKKGQSSIMVAVRLRPLWKKEEDGGEFSIVKILDDKLVILQDPQDFEADEQKNELRKNRTREKRYAFDFAFNQDVSTDHVFKNTTQNLCEAVLDGYNSTVFAYGCTGAGKTHTMLGNNENPGIMYQTMQEIFKLQRQMESDREYEIRISFLEIYNENIRDLTVDTHVKSDQINFDQYLELREDPVKGVMIANLKEIKVKSANEIFQILLKGNQNRMVEATGANATSSRSHAVLQIICEHTLKNSGITGEIQTGKLSLIDLAGSERASRTNNKGQRMIEGANINRSLLSLGNCINALHENHATGKTNYIPYRDSKLTRLLKDSLGGNCRTVMIANVSPSVKQFEDTHNTLKYANRAKNIKTSAQRNVLSVEYHVSQYTDIINKLKNEVSDLKAQLLAGGGNRSKIYRPITSYDQQKLLEDEQDKLISKNKDLIVAHFHEENKIKKIHHELEQKIETLRLQIDNKCIEIDKITDTTGQKNAVNVKIIREEIDDTKEKIKSLQLQFDSVYKQSQEIVLQRQQIKSNWQNANLTPSQCELLNLIVRENILQVNNLDALHRVQQQAMILKVRDAQQFRISEQLKLRDMVIKRALQQVETEIKKPVAASGQGTLSNRTEEISPVARDVYRILSDYRIIPYDEIQKNSSSLPPIKISPDKRNRGNYGEYVNIRKTQGQQSNLQQLKSLKNGLTASNSRKYLMNSQNQESKNQISITNQQVRSDVKLFENKRSQPVLQPGLFKNSVQQSPRAIVKNLIEPNGITPLYTRGQSKIGSGVNQPYSHQTQIHQIAQLKNQFSVAGISKPNRMRLRHDAGAYGALNSKEETDSLDHEERLRNKNGNRNYEEQKIRSSSVLSSGQQLQDNLALQQNNGQKRRVASGNVRDTQGQSATKPDNWISPQKGGGHLSLLQQKALQFKNKLMSVGSTPNLMLIEPQEPEGSDGQSKD